MLVSLQLNLSSAFAQEDISLGIANNISIVDKDVKDGMIVSFSDKGYSITKTPYDSAMYGIVATKAAITINLETGAKIYPIVYSGNAVVLVSGESGSIKKGDLVTSSGKPGIGMKATRSGYVLGSALEDYKAAKADQIGKINVTLNVHYFYSKEGRGGLAEILRFSSIATYETPLQALRYLLAALILLIAFILGFFSFARTAAKGVEALGRNPLAKRSIQLGILFNVLITLAIIFSGLIIAFFVIRL